MSGRAVPRPRATRRVDDGVRRVAPWAAAIAYGLAGAIHLYAGWEHLEEASFLATGMVLVAAVQLAAAGAALRPGATAGALTAAALVTMAALVVYVMSRTGDVWFLPAATGHGAMTMTALPAGTPPALGDGVPQLPGAHVEAVGLVDGACVLAELVAVVATCAVVPRRSAALLARSALLAALAVVVWRALA